MGLWNVGDSVYLVRYRVVYYEIIKVERFWV